MTIKVYAYGVIDSNEKIDETMRGLNDAPLFNIPYRDIGIVVSDLNAQIQKEDKKSVLKHEEVVEKLMDKFTVLPMRYLTLFSGKEQVLLMTKDYYDDFIENLDRLREKIEFGVKTIWPGDLIRERITTAHRKSDNLPLVASSSGKSFMKEKFENYKKSKGKLFDALAKSPKKDKFMVINLDDDNADYFSGLFNGKKYFYAIDKNAEFTPEKINLQISLPGDFNLYNALAAYCTGLGLGIEKNKILESLKYAQGVPGRMELVIDKPFRVFVDYAHTPDALQRVYAAFGGGLICVFGSCGGGRDKWKRPEMGKVANNYCKEIILTNEDPYDENPQAILDDIEKGLTSSNYEKIIDRREAISKALSLAQNDDTVIITGKGCEPWICLFKGRKMKWDDRRVVMEEFSKLRS